MHATSTLYMYNLSNLHFVNIDTTILRNTSFCVQDMYNNHFIKINLILLKLEENNYLTDLIVLLIAF